LNAPWFVRRSQLRSCTELLVHCAQSCKYQHGLNGGPAVRLRTADTWNQVGLTPLMYLVTWPAEPREAIHSSPVCRTSAMPSCSLGRKPTGGPTTNQVLLIVIPITAFTSEDGSFSGTHSLLLQSIDGRLPAALLNHAWRCQHQVRFSSLLLGGENDYH